MNANYEQRNNRNKQAVFILLLIFVIPAAVARPSFGQQGISGTQATHVNIPIVPPRSEDVSSVDGIMKAFYETMSGPPGQARQWGRDRTLYVPGIEFVDVGFRPNGTPYAKVVSYQEFADDSNPLFLRDGFFESEIHRETARYGNIAHVLSTYEMRNRQDGPILERGINSIALFYDGKRWWISATSWEAEDPKNPIPEKYLHG